MLKTRPWTPYLYVAPAILLIGFVFAYPIARVIDFSLRLIRGNSGPFVGADNYRLVFDDPTFVAAAKHSALLLLAVPVLLLISILVSVLLYERVRGWRIYRSVLFFPFILAVPVVGIVASYLFQLNGVINAILGGIGIDGPDWLGNGDMALWTLMFVIVWREVGFGIVLFLARLLTLPEEQIEAARIDGAGWWSAAALRDPARAARDDRVLRRRRCDHDARLGLRVRLHADRRRARGLHPGARALHLQPGVAELVAGDGVSRRGASDGGDDGLRRPALLVAPAVPRGGARMSSLDGIAVPPMPEKRAWWRRARLGVGLRQLALVAAAILALYPVWFMLSTAFKGQDQYLNDLYGFPWPLEGGNFSEAVRGGAFFTWMKNSAILTAGSAALATTFAALAAFAVARMRWRGRDVFLSINVALLIVPPVVMLIPLFTLFTQFSLVSTYWGVVILYAGLTLPFSVYLLSNFFRTLPRELFESAVMDKASHLRILWSIVLPLSAPALVTLIVVNSLWVWNELLIALVFLPDEGKRTLMVGVTVFQSRYNLDVPVTMAGMLLASIPMFLLYLFGQRLFVRGLTAGAVKG